jgi:UrcA family protein
MTCRIIEGEEIMSTLLRRAGGAAFAFSVTFGLVAVLAEQPAMAADVTVTAQIEEDDLPKERVTTADLDLSNPTEVRKLQARIRAASRRVCGYSGVGIARSQVPCRSAVQASVAPQIARLSDGARRLAGAGEQTELTTVLTVTAPER